MSMDMASLSSQISYYMMNERASLLHANGSSGGNRVNHVTDRRSDSIGGRRQGSSGDNRRINMTERLYGIGRPSPPHRLNGFRRNIVNWPRLLSNYSLAELKGYIHLMAMDQSGCQVLFEMLDEGTTLDVIFDEIVYFIIALMLNPYGSYLVQKVLEKSSEAQRREILFAVIELPWQVADISLNSHGPRAEQKLIEIIEGKAQISFLLSALGFGFRDLTTDLNGIRVLQSCLKHFSSEENEVIFKAATLFCVHIATHQHGCFIMQEFIDKASGECLEDLINEISSNGLHLSQHPYGNFVVQHIIKLKSQAAAAILNSQFQGNYVNLSVQKFSSHVVESCLIHFEDARPIIVQELLDVPKFHELMQDQFANYVIQAALTVTTGRLGALLVRVVKPHQDLRAHPHCRKLFSSIKPRK